MLISSQEAIGNSSMHNDLVPDCIWDVFSLWSKAVRREGKHASLASILLSGKGGFPGVLPIPGCSGHVSGHRSLVFSQQLITHLCWNVYGTPALLTILHVLYHFWRANTFTFTFVLLACSRWGTHCLHDTDVKTVIGYVACVGKPYKLVANLALEATFFCNLLPGSLSQMCYFIKGS